MENLKRNNSIKTLWIVVYFLVLIWSGVNPKDQFTWFLEVVPAIIGAILLLVTYNSFRLTPMLYFFILLHCIVLMVGGHYTYAEVPLFDWIQDIFDMGRNNYDKLGHFMQGFVPALLAREILIRKNIVNGAVWMNVFVLSVCLAFSAFYELIEWWVALATGGDAEAFLGTQGYVWDTQSDMMLALIGAIACLLLLSRRHNYQIQDITLID